MTTATHSPYYTEYLNSFAWHIRRQCRIAAVGNRCERCGASGALRVLQVHHLTYERLGRELDSDLKVVCLDCHKIEDRERAERTEGRVWEARVDGYATKRWGEYWADSRDWDEAEEAFIDFLDRQGDY